MRTGAVIAIRTANELGQWPFKETADEMTAAQWMILAFGLHPIQLTDEPLDADDIVSMIKDTFA